MGIVKNSPVITSKTDLPGAANHTIKATEVKEEDEDESESSRKLVKISSYFFALLYGLAPDPFHLHLKNRLPFCKHFSYTIPCKYIVQRVIRI